MSYIEKSKEIYKQIRKNKTEENPGGDPTLIPLRGMWVSGTHTEPVYMDHYMTVTAFTSTPAVAVDYVSKYIEHTENTNLKFMGINKSWHMNIVTYHRNTMPDQTDNTNLKFLGVNKSWHMNIVTYGRQYPEDQKDYLGLKFMGINMTRRIVIGEKTTSAKNTDDGPTHSITITGFTSTDPTIS